MRIFVALDIDDAIRQRILRFMEGVRGFAPEARWVRPESLHVTLKFIGEKPPDTVEQIKHALSAVRTKSFELVYRGYGFFPTQKSARVFWVGITAGQELTALAESLDQAAYMLGIPKEDHPYSPHLTLARGGSGAPRKQRDDSQHQRFQRLQEKLSALPQPEFGTMTAREFFLYESRLMRGGSLYTKVAQFALE